MHKLSALMFGAALALSTAAFAQTPTVTVDLSPISAALAEELGIEVDDLPTTIDLSADIAAEVCGVEIGTIADSCVASVATDDLTAVIESELGDDNDSAREFAPGQQEGSAREAAPGQQGGDAKDFAPGQVKKADTGVDDSEGNNDTVDTHGKDSAPGQVKKQGE